MHNIGKSENSHSLYSFHHNTQLPPLYVDCITRPTLLGRKILVNQLIYASSFTATIRYLLCLVLVFNKFSNKIVELVNL